MNSEAAASAAAQQKHHRYMNFGKKQRYIEVFQCSGEDMNLFLSGAPASGGTGVNGVAANHPPASVVTSVASGSKNPAQGLLQHPGMLANAAPTVSASSNASLTGLDPLGQQAALANLAAANPFLLAQQNLATLGQNASQFQSDPNQALAGLYKGPLPPVSTAYGQVAQSHSVTVAQQQAALIQAGAFPGLNNFMLNPGLLRLPGLPQTGAANPALLPGGSGLMQNPALMAAATQQRLLLQQQQHAALFLQQQQQQQRQFSAQPQLHHQLTAGAGKRSYEQAFALAAATNTAGTKRVYSAGATISANPTTYANSGGNGSS